MSNELVVGNTRTFTNDNRVYVIKEILNKPNNISLLWNWTDSVCPSCHAQLTRTVTHIFYRIEILVDQTIADANIVKTDLILLGDTIDNRKMIFPIDKYDDVLSQSVKYVSFVGV